jgi:hypothetical protein
MNFASARKISLVLLLMGSGPLLKAQDSAYARRMIDTLTSPYFAGRGYVDNGDAKAAAFLSAAFAKAGLEHFAQASDESPYFQPFQMTVNTFPGEMLVKADGKELKAGADYIVNPASGGCRGSKFKVLYPDSITVAKWRSGKKKPKTACAWALDNKLATSLRKDGGLDWLILQKPAALIILKEDKLVWSVASTSYSFPYISIKKESFPSGAKSIYLKIDQALVLHTAKNVIGYVKGSVHPDSFLILGAHYDHLGKMGKEAYFPGANDNASGTAILLNLVRYFSKAENRPAYSIMFISFAAEEAGLVGSHYYTEHPLFPLKNIAFMLNMDLMAEGADGVMVVNGSVFPAQFARLQHINDSAHYLKEIKVRGKAANSDHYWFSEKGVPAFFFYLLGAYPAYHDIYDTPDKPTLKGYNGAFRLIRDYLGSYR